MTRLPAQRRTTSAVHRPAPLRQLAIPPDVKKAMSGAAGVRAFSMGECTLMVAREPLGHAGGLEWHLSISCQDRYPTWDEIADARDRLLPADETFGMVLPPASSYVNVHDFCFHLHRLPDGFGR